MDRLPAASAARVADVPVGVPRLVSRSDLSLQSGKLDPHLPFKFSRIPGHLIPLLRCAVASTGGFVGPHS
jgi:hypothetical protein